MAVPSLESRLASVRSCTLQKEYAHYRMLASLRAVDASAD